MWLSSDLHARGIGTPYYEIEDVDTKARVGQVRVQKNILYAFILIYIYIYLYIYTHLYVYISPCGQFLYSISTSILRCSLPLFFFLSHFFFLSFFFLRTPLTHLVFFFEKAALICARVTILARVLGSACAVNPTLSHGPRHKS